MEAHKTVRWGHRRNKSPSPPFLLSPSSLPSISNQTHSFLPFRPHFHSYPPSTVSHTALSPFNYRFSLLFESPPLLSSLFPRTWKRMLGVSSAGAGIRSIVSAEKSSGLSMDDSSYSVEFKLDLGLGLSVGSRDSYRKTEHDQRSQFSRILTDQDTCSVVSLCSSASSPTSSVCSSSLSRANATSVTQRRADSLEEISNGASQSQVVGWPPVRVSRMNSVGNRAKIPETENSMNESGKCSNSIKGESHGGCENINGNLKDKESARGSLFVKVNMDGIPIGRKVNLIAHSSYETLVQTLEDMFQDSTTTVGGFSKYVLTYEDKDGDWMLVGDVPWGMFLSSVKRLRIMRSCEANGNDRCRYSSSSARKG